MFSFFKSNPIKKYNKIYDTKLKQARDAQRAGNIQAYTTLTEEAQRILKKIEDLQKL